MRKQKGLNKHQKAVYRVGERQVGREQIAELLEMAGSAEVEERLVAAEYLCPCHVRTRIPAVWEALYRMMEDPDPRVRHRAWHTIEDGGRPQDEAGAKKLEGLCRAETDPKVRQFAERTLNKVLGSRLEKEMTLLKVAGRPPIRERGKCDFCGESNVFVDRDLQTMIPTAPLPRAAWICDRCAQAG